MPLHVSKTCTHHQDVKIVSHSLWYHHTYRWPSGAQVERVLSQPVHQTASGTLQLPPSNVAKLGHVGGR